MMLFKEDFVDEFGSEWERPFAESIIDRFREVKKSFKGEISLFKISLDREVLSYPPPLHEEQVASKAIDILNTFPWFEGQSLQVDLWIWLGRSNNGPPVLVLDVDEWAEEEEESVSHEELEVVSASWTTDGF